MSKRPSINDVEKKKTVGVNAMFDGTFSQPTEKQIEPEESDPRIRRTYMLPLSLTRALDRYAADHGIEKSEVVEKCLRQVIGSHYFR